MAEITRVCEVVGGVTRGLSISGPRRDQHDVGRVLQLPDELWPIGLSQRHRSTVLAQASGNRDEVGRLAEKVAVAPGAEVSTSGGFSGSIDWTSNRMFELGNRIPRITCARLPIGSGAGRPAVLALAHAAINNTRAVPTNRITHLSRKTIV